MALLALLKMAQDKQGIAHKIAIEGLRKYFWETDVEKVIDEMQQISNVSLLKYMIEAGLRDRLYSAFLLYVDNLPIIGRE